MISNLEDSIVVPYFYRTQFVWAQIKKTYFVRFEIRGFKLNDLKFGEPNLNNSKFGGFNLSSPKFGGPNLSGPKLKGPNLCDSK